MEDRTLPARAAQRLKRKHKRRGKRPRAKSKRRNAQTGNGASWASSMDLRPQSVLATWPLKTALVFFRNQRARCAEAADALNSDPPCFGGLGPVRATTPGLSFAPR